MWHFCAVYVILISGIGGLIKKVLSTLRIRHESLEESHKNKPENRVHKKMVQYQKKPEIV